MIAQGFSHRSFRVPRVLAVAVVLLAGCEREPGDDDGGSCSTRDVQACTPQYDPTWERVFTETIAPSCGVAGTACHGEPGAAGSANGFVISDAAATHDMLISEGFVVPGDAACSDVMVRLDSDDDSFRMPPGSQPLDETERCAVAKWIAAGASP